MPVRPEPIYDYIIKQLLMQRPGQTFPDLMKGCGIENRKHPDFRALQTALDGLVQQGQLIAEQQGFRIHYRPAVHFP